ncbi:hypothetical protein [Bacillus cereus]
MNKVLNKLTKEMEKDGKEVAKEWEMGKFVIVNKEVREETPDLFNGAFNTHSKRIYFGQIPTSTIDFLIQELLRISEGVEAIQIEFDRINDGYNIEFEVYLLNGRFDELTSSNFKTNRSPRSVSVSERYYFEFINKLKGQNCQCNTI